MLPILVFAGLLIIAGVAGAFGSGVSIVPALLPVIVGAALALLEGSPARVKGVAMLTAVVLVMLAMPEADGLADLFAALLLFGGAVIAAAGLHRAEPRLGHYPLMAVLLLAIQALVRAETGLAFYVAWEFVTLSSFLLIAQGAHRGLSFCGPPFCLAAAFLLFAGFAIVAAQTDSLKPAGASALQISQGKLAELVALSLPTLQRVMRRLQQKGLIELGYGQIRIVDRQGLVALSTGDFPPADPGYVTLAALMRASVSTATARDASIGKVR